MIPSDTLERPRSGLGIRVRIERPANKQRLTELLCLLGLTLSQAESYCAILGEAEREKGVARIPDCLWANLPNEIRVLQSWGLLLPFKDSVGGVSVRPIPAQLAARAIFTRFLWETCYSEDDIPKLDSPQRQALACRKDLCLQLEEQLKEQFGITTTTDARESEPSQLRMIPGETVSEELAMHLLRAKHHIRGVTVPRWAPGLPLVWEAIRNRRSCGIEYWRLADELTFASFGSAINRRDIQQVGVALRVAPRRLLSQKFFIVDQEAVFVFWDSPAGSPFPLKASVTSTQAIVQKCISWFDDLWGRAVPAESLLAEFDAFRTPFVAKCRSLLGESGERAGHGLVDYGRFYFDGDWQSEELRTLLSVGYVQSFPDRAEVFVPELVRAIESRVAHISGPEPQTIREDEEHV